MNKWLLIDAQNLVLGRLASDIARRLRCKDQVCRKRYELQIPHIIVINAEKIALTGKNKSQERLYWHTGWPGGIKFKTREQILDGAHPERCLMRAVKGMLRKRTIRNLQLSHLRIYSGHEHPHVAQKPELCDFGLQNKKNIGVKYA